MSGICGICEEGAQLRAPGLGAMIGAIRLPGESSPGTLSTKGVLMGVSPRFDQQCLGKKNDLFVAISADLCNLAALAAEVESKPTCPAFSAAEVVADLYTLYGLGFLDKLQGSFAVAIWDAAQQELAIAIDPLGLETLYWSIDGGRLLFSSRVAGIASTRRDCQVNPEAVAQYLLHTVVPSPMTIYRDVHRLQPGTVLTWKRGIANTRQYWDLRYEESEDQKSSFWAEQLRSELRQAVHSHVEASPSARAGCYLSGGTDSSSVLAFASELHDGFSAFSIYFENPRYDELEFARLAASNFGARHHEMCLTAEDAAQAIPAIVDYYDEPSGNPSTIGAYYCARLAQQHGVTVLLAGDGGDELFAGNERYSSDKKFALYQSLPKGVREGVIKPLARMLPASGFLSLPARFIRRAELSNPHRILSYLFALSYAASEIFDPSFLSQASPESFLDIAALHFHSAPKATSELNRLLYLDVKITLADNDIRKVKGTAEMAGVRARFPLLDRRLVEFSGCIPSRLKLRGFEKRYIFKKAMSGTLPDKILYKKKHGFGVPIGYWAETDPKIKSLAAILDEPETRQRGYFRPEFLTRLRTLNRTYPAYYGDVLWAVLMLELWHRQHYKVCPGDILELGAVHGH